MTFSDKVLYISKRITYQRSKGSYSARRTANCNKVDIYPMITDNHKAIDMETTSSLLLVTKEEVALEISINSVMKPIKIDKMR